VFIEGLETMFLNNLHHEFTTNKIYFKKVSPKICELYSHQIKYFTRGSTDNLWFTLRAHSIFPFLYEVHKCGLCPHKYIFLRIISQEPSPVTCDSLFELIPNIYYRIFHKKASPAICKRRSKYILWNILQEGISGHLRTPFQISLIGYFVRSLRR